MWGTNKTREGSVSDSDWSGIRLRSDSELQANNPVKYVDPTGKFFIIDDLIVAVIFICHRDTKRYSCGDA